MQGVDNDTPRGNIGPHQPQSLPPPPQAHPPATTRSPQPLAFPAVAGVDMEFDKDAHDIPRSAAESARNAEELLLRIEGYRKLCHSQWDEAKAVLSSARQENVRYVRYSHAICGVGIFVLACNYPIVVNVSLEKSSSQDFLSECVCGPLRETSSLGITMLSLVL